MLNIVQNLFESNDYNSQIVEDGILFSKIDLSNKIDYWFVINKNDINSLIEEEQEIFFLKCKEINNFELKKNISMLIVWNTGGRLDFVNMKKQIMPIEEDPNYFKKHVLYYSPNELEEIYTQISSVNINDFFLNNLSDESIFAAYKANPVQGSWRELFYRLVIKLPFIKIDIDSTLDIESLQQTINNKLETDNTLVHLNAKVFELYEELDHDAILHKDVSEIIDDLLVAEEGGITNGN